MIKSEFVVVSHICSLCLSLGRSDASSCTCSCWQPRIYTHHFYYSCITLVNNLRIWYNTITQSRCYLC